jgi:hypothetical protein
MNRRNFIYSAGIIITASSMPLFFFNSATTKNPKKRPNPEEFKKAVLKGIAYGVNAPNPHNTQAWKFQLLSENEMLFFVDKTRLLKATDPTTRQIHIGCGCFLECMKLGMQRAGYKTLIDYFPKGIYQQEDIGKKPIAKISFSKNDSEKASFLSDSIFQRKTSRLKYKESAVSNSEFKTLLEKTSPGFSEILLINQLSKLKQILPVLYQGMEIETFTYNTHDESRKWFRQNDELIEQMRDGINFEGGGTTGISKWYAERQLKTLDPKIWHNVEDNKLFLKKHKNKVLSSKGIVIFKTNTNSFLDWIHTGHDYFRFTLACTQKGLYLHPLSQVLQEFDEMKLLREDFEDLIKVRSPEKVQMAVRIGKSKTPFYSFRRFTNDFVIS